MSVLERPAILRHVLKFAVKQGSFKSLGNLLAVTSSWRDTILNFGAGTIHSALLPKNRNSFITLFGNLCVAACVARQILFKQPNFLIRNQQQPHESDPAIVLRLQLIRMMIHEWKVIRGFSRENGKYPYGLLKEIKMIGTRRGDLVFLIAIGTGYAALVKIILDELEPELNSVCAGHYALDFSSYWTVLPVALLAHDIANEVRTDGEDILKMLAAAILAWRAKKLQRKDRGRRKNRGSSTAITASSVAKNEVCFFDDPSFFGRTAVRPLIRLIYDALEIRTVPDEARYLRTVEYLLNDLGCCPNEVGADTIGSPFDLVFDPKFSERPIAPKILMLLLYRASPASAAEAVIPRKDIFVTVPKPNRWSGTCSLAKLLLLKHMRPDNTFYEGKNVAEMVLMLLEFEKRQNNNSSIFLIDVVSDLSIFMKSGHLDLVTWVTEEVLEQSRKNNNYDSFKPLSTFKSLLVDYLVVCCQSGQLATLRYLMDVETRIILDRQQQNQIQNNSTANLIIPGFKTSEASKQEILYRGFILLLNRQETEAKCFADNPGFEQRVVNIFKFLITPKTDGGAGFDVGNYKNPANGNSFLHDLVGTCSFCFKNHLLLSFVLGLEAFSSKTINKSSFRNRNQQTVLDVAGASYQYCTVGQLETVKKMIRGWVNV